MSSSLPKSLRTVVCDDHALIRSGLVALLEDTDGVEVIGEAGDGDELVERVRELKPDLVITDVSMRRMSGLDAMVLLRQSAPECRVLVLSMHDSPEFVRQAFIAGASGYLLKDSAIVEMQLALRAVREGEVFVSPRISSQMVAQLHLAPGTSPGGTDTAPSAVSRVATDSPLTPRQTQILTLLARGRAAKQIAYDLGLSVKTVETHRTMIMDRLGIRDLAGLVLYAVKHGLVSASER